MFFLSSSTSECTLPSTDGCQRIRWYQHQQWSMPVGMTVKWVIFVRETRQKVQVSSCWTTVSSALILVTHNLPITCRYSGIHSLSAEDTKKNNNKNNSGTCTYAFRACGRTVCLRTFPLPLCSSQPNALHMMCTASGGRLLKDLGGKHKSTQINSRLQIFIIC